MSLCCYSWLIGPAGGLLAVAVLWYWAVSRFLLGTADGDDGSPRALTSLSGKHVLITGGSKGIGRALAVEAVKRGASLVTIVARDRRHLDDAREELTQLAALRNKPAERQDIAALSIDVTADYPTIKAAVDRLVADQGGRPVDVLINNAGGSVEAAFDQLPVDAFEKQMRLNYLSAVYVTRAVLEGEGGMKRRANDGTGRIVFISSQAGQVGVFGYTAYSPTKFALRGLAESLRMELKPHGVWVTVAYPPNTATDGFAEELKHMPEETRLITDTSDSAVFQPSWVAERIWDDVAEGKFQSTIGLDGWMLGTLTAGMTPVQHRRGGVWEATQQALLTGLFRLVSLFYLNRFDAIVARCHRQKKEPSQAAD